jgi:hypothetical protein
MQCLVKSAKKLVRSIDGKSERNFRNRSQSTSDIENRNDLDRVQKMPSVGVRNMETFLARHGIDPQRVAGWHTIQYHPHNPPVYIVQCFMLDGSIQWVRHPDLRDENGFEECAAHHWKLDD